MFFLQSVFFCCGCGDSYGGGRSLRRLLHRLQLRLHSVFLYLVVLRIKKVRAARGEHHHYQSDADSGAPSAALRCVLRRHAFSIRYFYFANFCLYSAIDFSIAATASALPLTPFISTGAGLPLSILYVSRKC